VTYTVTAECVDAVSSYPAIAVRLLQIACMQFGTLSLNTVTAECVDAVLYPAIAVRFLQSSCMYFGILPLQYSYCIVRTCSLVSCHFIRCHCSKVTEECMHVVRYPAIAVQ
jgi:hypothetical protein